MIQKDHTRRRVIRKSEASMTNAVSLAHKVNQLEILRLELKSPSLAEASDHVWDEASRRADELERAIWSTPTVDVGEILLKLKILDDAISSEREIGDFLDNRTVAMVGAIRADLLRLNSIDKDDKSNLGSLNQDSICEPGHASHPLGTGQAG